MYERITGEAFDKANLRRQVVDAQRMVEPAGRRRTGEAHRSAELFRLASPGMLMLRLDGGPARPLDDG